MLVANKSKDNSFARQSVIQIHEQYSTKIKVVQSIYSGPISIEKTTISYYSEINNKVTMIDRRKLNNIKM